MVVEVFIKNSKGVFGGKKEKKARKREMVQNGFPFLVFLSFLPQKTSSEIFN